MVAKAKIDGVEKVYDEIGGKWILADEPPNEKTIKKLAKQYAKRMKKIERLRAKHTKRLMAEMDILEAAITASSWNREQRKNFWRDIFLYKRKQKT